MPDVEFPTCILNSNGVDKLIEETSHATEQLEDCDTLRTSVVGEELDEESC